MSARKCEDMQDSILDPKQQQVIIYLLQGSSIEDAAKRVGVDPSTIHRWKKNHAFMKVYRGARSSVLDDAVWRISQSVEQITQSLVDLATDKATPEAARVSACRAALKFLQSTVGADTAQEIAELREDVALLMAYTKDRKKKR